MANAASTSVLQNVIWFIDPLVLLAAAAGIWRRQKRSSFRFFLSYLLLVAIKSYSSFLVNHWFGNPSWPYTYTYYVFNYSAIGLTFLVLYEVLSTILTSGTWTVSLRAFLLLIAIVLIVVTGLTLMIGHQYHKVAIINALLTVEVSLRYVQVAVLALLAIMTIFFGFYWMDMAFGVALGFAFYAAMMIANSEVFARWGQSYKHTYGVVDVSAYLVASCIWLIYAWKRPRSAVPDLPADRLSNYAPGVDRLIR